jgi:O-6-methylguanine DNA methyltransferase
MEKIYYTGLDTPMGIMWAATSERGLVQFQISNNKDSFMKELKSRIEAEYIEDSSKFLNLKNQLRRYFKGEKIIFDLPLDLRGTSFQVDVWNAIYAIPNGKLTSYGKIAKAIERPNAVRAVGNAVGANPIGLIVPCHRVVAGDGSLGGFGGGLFLKRKLLVQEGIFETAKGKPEKGVDLRLYFD